MSDWRLLRLVSAVLLGVFAGVCHGGVAVQPANVILELDKGRPSGRFVISNTSGTEERYRITAAHFAYSVDGGLQIVPPDGSSLAPWVKFNPKEFVLPPKSKRAVRFVILPRPNLPTGEYWGAMQLESLNTQSVVGRGKDGRDMRVKVVPAVLVPIYGTVGKPLYEGTLSNVGLNHTDDGTALAVTVNNIGQGRLMVKGRYWLTDSSNREVASGDLPRGLVLPGLTRNFQSSLGRYLPRGEYLLHVEYGARTLGDRMLVDERLVMLE